MNTYIFPLTFVLQEMQPSRLPPPSPHPTRTSPIRHGKRFGSLTVTEEHREAAIKGEATGREEKLEQLRQGGWMFFVISNSELTSL